MPHHPGFSHLWKQDQLSDVQLILCVDVPAAAGEAADSSSEQQRQTLQTLPVHSAILSCSPFFLAQVARWPTEPGAKKRARDLHPATPQIVLTLQHADQQPAAEAVLQAMYAFNWEDVLSQLPHLQLLHAAVLSDMWELPAASETAVQRLMQAAAGGSLQEDAFQHFCSMQSRPACLHPLIAAFASAATAAGQQAHLKQLLLSLFGDLEAVWADAESSKLLMQLPLYAARMLLSYSDLKVASEDTVLYTAQQYVKQLTDAALKKVARQQLALAVRCQHLSLFWLSALALDEDPDSLLSHMRPSLAKLLLLRLGAGHVAGESIREKIRDAPPSWSMGKRASRQLSSVQWVWELDVGELKAAQQSGASRVGRLRPKWRGLTCPRASPPLGGLSWCLVCGQKPAASSSRWVGLYIQPLNLPGNAFWSCSLSISVAGGPCRSKDVASAAATSSQGWSDFFDVGPMAGGWDDAAWEAKGLPATGKLVVTCTVSNVGHCS